MRLSGLSGPLVALLSILQLGGAAAVVAITGIQLAGVDLQQLDTLLHQKQCLMSDDTANTGLCMYTYALGGVSIVFTLCIGLLQVCTCNRCGCGTAMDSAFALLAAAWWAVGGFVVSSNATRANGAAVARREWRDAVAILTWVCCGLFVALFSVHITRIIAYYCGRRRRAEAEFERSILPQSALRSSTALELGKEVRGRAYLAGHLDAPSQGPAARGGPGGGGPANAFRAGGKTANGKAAPNPFLDGPNL